MLLTITTTHSPPDDLGYLLHKHPGRVQRFEQSFGQAHVFYPEVSAERCTACLLLDVDPVALTRNRQAKAGMEQYVNDRPYVASSFLSVALADVFGSALAGRCRDRPELATTPLPLVARLDVLPVRGGSTWIERLFVPLGYTVEAVRHPLDATFPEWGESPYYTVTLRATTTLAQLLTHLYVLVPVFDDRKHYFIDAAEVEKLLAKGSGWLPTHPHRDEITRRYLGRWASLTRAALARLVPESESESATDDVPVPAESVSSETAPERSPRLNDQRLGTVMAALRAAGARRVIDLGCGEGKLLTELVRDRTFTEIVGMDVSIRPLEIAARKLKLEAPETAAGTAARVRLLHGSLLYRDARLSGFDAAAVVEVIEHLDPPRLAAFERVLFECARPRTVVLTTPNREYNAMWETLAPDQLRHPDHRFEWTRAEFQTWAAGIGSRFGYDVRFVPVGQVDVAVGPPTQMGVFTRQESAPASA